VRFEIILAPGATRAFRSLPAHVRSAVRDGIELHLRFEPRKISKSRIKRLRGLDRPQYRLRIGEIRVFYDVKDSVVEVLAVVPKAEAEKRLKEEGAPNASGGAGKG
jgi:mRNA-degrading endonuclease RelE of RelBE toxin-antitoxin system